MKKHYPLLLAILVAFTSFFVSCDEDNFEDLNRCKITVTATKGGKVKISKYLETSENVLYGSEIEVVATADEGYAFTGWYLDDSTEPVNIAAEYTFTVKEDITLIAKFERRKTYIGGYEYIDLGLSVKWATCNVGASVPEEYGGYYAWGEAEEKSNYDWSTYKWRNGSYGSMTKYCTKYYYGTVDNKTVLDTMDDVAHVKWGGTWRMPTKAEQDELRNNCTWEWTTQNGVNGYKVTGSNGNSIFLPAAGYRYGTEAISRGSYGYYWSSSLCRDSSYNAYVLSFKSGYYDWYDNYRYIGYSVRPVSE